MNTSTMVCLKSFFTITVTLAIYFFPLADSITIRNVDTDRLIWAPITSLKSPYVTFINDFNLPTWATRHQMTKRNGRLHLQLARNVPFAVVCGACFQHSIFRPNLTMSISDHASISVSKRRKDNSFQYSVGVNECLMTYLITEPIQKDGTITCTLNRGKQVIHEVVTFDALDADIQESPEDLEVSASSSSPIELQCPQLDETSSSSSKYNPSVNVWHEDHKPSSQQQKTKAAVGSPILSMRPKLYLDRPKNTITIVCSVYNIFTLRTVRQRRYKIQGHRNNAKSEYHISGDLLSIQENDDAGILPPRISFSSSILAIIILAVVVCILLAAIGTYRFFAAARMK